MVAKHAFTDAVSAPFSLDENKKPITCITVQFFSKWTDASFLFFTFLRFSFLPSNLSLKRSIHTVNFSRPEKRKRLYSVKAHVMVVHTTTLFQLCVFSPGKDGAFLHKNARNQAESMQTRYNVIKRNRQYSQI